MGVGGEVVGLAGFGIGVEEEGCAAVFLVGEGGWLVGGFAGWGTACMHAWVGVRGGFEESSSSRYMA